LEFPYPGNVTQEDSRPAEIASVTEMFHTWGMIGKKQFESDTVENNWFYELRVGSKVKVTYERNEQGGDVISNVLLLEDGGDADAVEDMEVSIEEDEGDDNTLFIRHIINKFEDRLEVKAEDRNTEVELFQLPETRERFNKSCPTAFGYC